MKKSLFAYSYSICLEEEVGRGRTCDTVKNKNDLMSMSEGSKLRFMHNPKLKQQTHYNLRYPFPPLSPKYTILDKEQRVGSFLYQN